MSWCGFRPSDDLQTYGYNVPVNMYAQAALERALEINAQVWRSASFEERARALADTMRQGAVGGGGGGPGWVAGGRRGVFGSGKGDFCKPVQQRLTGSSP